MKTNPKVKPSHVSKAETLASEFLTLKAQLEPLNDRLEQARKDLKLFVETCPEEKALLAGHEFSIIERVNEKFELKLARVELGADVLQPFIKISTSRYLGCK